VAAAATSSDVTSKFGVASDAASKALSRANTVSDAASKAMSKASNALSRASDALSKASDALSKTTSMAGTYIYSIPGAGSRAVHEIVRTSAGLLKIVYSSVAA
jgi:ABC-type transporter Mla subunit MlaD